MRSYTRIWIPLSLLAVIVAISCRTDPEIFPSPPSPISRYIGVYSRTVEGTDSNLVEPITWTFAEKTFTIGCDYTHYASKADSVPFCFTDCAGYYTIDGGIVLSGPGSSSLDSNLTFRACGGPYSPYGSYVLDQSKAGELIMTSLTYNPQGKKVTRIIHLFEQQ